MGESGGGKGVGGSGGGKGVRESGGGGVRGGKGRVSPSKNK